MTWTVKQQRRVVLTDHAVDQAKKKFPVLAAIPWRELRRQLCGAAGHATPSAYGHRCVGQGFLDGKLWLGGQDLEVCFAYTLENGCHRILTTLTPAEVAGHGASVEPEG